MEETTEQQGNSKEERVERLKPWQFKKGQSGNPTGRPKGPSLKEWARNYLAGLNDEERLEYLEGMNKAEVWKMGEGNPQTNNDITTGGEKVTFQIVNYGDNQSTPQI